MSDREAIRATRWFVERVVDDHDGTEIVCDGGPASGTKTAPWGQPVLTASPLHVRWPSLRSGSCDCPEGGTLPLPRPPRSTRIRSARRRS